jgi:hypothetical protein
MRGGPGLGNIAPEQADIKLACRGLGHGNTQAVVLAPVDAPGDARPHDAGLRSLLQVPEPRRHPLRRLPRPDDGQGLLPATMLKPGIPSGPSGATRPTARNLISSIHLAETDLEAHNQHLDAKYAAMTEAEQRADLFRCDDAEVVVVACNTPARMAKGAVETPRSRGSSAGLFRPLTLWPFPIGLLASLLPRAADRRGRGLERAARGRAPAGRLEGGPRDAPRSSTCATFGGVLPQQAEIVACVLAGSAAATRGWRYERLLQRFERHGHGDGLKGQSTHYCPGCGHGLAHKYLGEAIEELGIQDRTVAVSPVGCSVFLYYYLDVGNTQAAHGRAPAVALGHKLANPESIVISYQGDGDLASIGLAEIVQRRPARHPHQRDLRQQRDLRDDRRPDGPDDPHGPEDEHQPLRPDPLHRGAAEGGRDDGGPRRPVYVERVALFDAKNRGRREEGDQEGAPGSRRRGAASPSSRSSPSARPTSR